MAPQNTSSETQFNPWRCHQLVAMTVVQIALGATTVEQLQKNSLD
jgi:hypothetical protein